MWNWDRLMIGLDLSLKNCCDIVLGISVLLCVFFQYSPRMNSRLEAPAPRRARQSNALAAAAVRLRLLPDARTGQRSNFFLLLCASWLMARWGVWIHTIVDGIEYLRTLYALRGGIMTFDQSRWGVGNLWILDIVAWILFFSFVLPFFFTRKNREFYIDVVALCALLLTAVCKFLMCWPMGCCCGLPCAWGVYNHFAEATVFPLQLVEGAVSLLTYVIGVLFMLYAKSYKPGRGAALCLIFYAAPRFVWEFFRYKGEAYWAGEANGLFGLSMMQVICAALCVLAVAWWIWLLPLEQKLMDRFWRFADRRRAKRKRKA